MTQYRVYFMNPWSGHIDSVELIDAADDQSAIDATKSRLTDQPIELWCEHRKIARFELGVKRLGEAGSPNLIERAYELARGGGFGDIEPLVVRLKAEGYEGVDMHLRGFSSLRRELTRVCRLSWIAAGNAPLPIRRGPRRPKADTVHSRASQ